MWRAEVITETRHYLANTQQAEGRGISRFIYLFILYFWADRFLSKLSINWMYHKMTKSIFLLTGIIKHDSM